MDPKIQPLRIAFLVGSDSEAIRDTIGSVSALDCVIVTGILLDTASLPIRRRFRSLRKNIGREGFSYAVHRALNAVSAALDSIAARLIPQAEVEQILRTAFSEKAFSLRELAARIGCPLIEAGNLNSSEAADSLGRCRADLGLVLGTRVLKRSTFSIPRLGCLNLHKGKVPEYRGMPPAFWELFEGAQSAGITVHFVDDGLDTGDIIATSEIPIHPHETELSLRKKLDLEGSRVLARAVRDLHGGTARRVPQSASTLRPKTRPTRAQRLELARRNPGAVRLQNPAKNILKTGIYLGLYYSGIYSLVRAIRRMRRSSRAAIILYHRVNDFSVDPLTTSTRAFAEHVILLKHRYSVRSSEWLAGRIRKREPIPPDTVIIHFDDCYRDVYSAAAQLLQAAGIPGTAFISSGFMGTDRAFKHDEDQYPFRYENMKAEEVRLLPTRGVSVAAHTVNHADLGKVSLLEAEHEVFYSRKQLETVMGRPVTLFSFPFGRKENIREDVRQLVRDAGFEALFSAYGGFVRESTDVFDVPRMGVSSAHRPLDLMMELEGISFNDFRS
ncbi:MAG: polysaccharide deacetylase family protein [Acidobacteriaceae bacterium]|nr:polysaccharide deacetylase family protein [Acidobacteriaceae bacterium]